MTTVPVLPKRGGIHSIYGVYVGGATIDDNYHLIGTRHYKSSTQRRNAKSIGRIESDLRSARDSTSILKFNGNLEGTPNGAELDKKTFLKTIERLSMEHGHHYHWFYPDPNDLSTMIPFFRNVHSFSLEHITTEQDGRLAASAGEIEAYDEYELDDLALSRLLVESRVSDSVRETVEICFGHEPYFADASGPQYLMMVLDSCNASIVHDIDGAKKKFEDLTLLSFPGENISDFSTEAKRLLTIMGDAYALPVNAGSQLLYKVSKTSCEYFNRLMFDHLSATKRMEKHYRLLNPRAIMNDTDYTTYGPYGILATLQK